MEKEKVLDKVQKILAKASNNSSPAESETAFLLAQELLIKHNLTMNDVTSNNANLKEIIEDKGISKGRLNWWHGSLAMILADNFGCKTYKRYSYGITQIIFIGVKQDVEIIKIIYSHAIDMINYHSSEYIKNIKPSLRASYKNTYIQGYLSGLKEKFRKQVEANGWGLVVVAEEAVQKKYDSINLKKSNKSQANFSKSDSALRAGYIEGKNYNPSFGSIESAN